MLIQNVVEFYKNLKGFVTLWKKIGYTFPKKYIHSLAPFHVIQTCDLNQTLIINFDNINIVK